MHNPENSKNQESSHDGGHTLLIAIIAGVLIGGIVGSIAPEFSTKIAFLGELFLNALKMMIVPLVVASMINGITSLGDIRKLGKPGFWSIALFAITTAIAVFIGLVFVNLIQPGVGFSVEGQEIAQKVADKTDNTLLGVVEKVLLDMVAPNIIEAAANTKILPLIFFALLFGGILTTLPHDKSKVLLAFFSGLDQVMMHMVNLIMWTAPVGIFALIAGRLGEAGGGTAFVSELQKLTWYVVCVILALIVHAIVLGVILAMIAKKSPIAYFSGMFKALTTAFSTSSSSATLPLTMESVENNNGVSSQAASFVLPLGATVNMNGTALYESVAALFIAQAAGIELSIGEQVIVFITASLAAIGAAGIPEAGLVTLVLVLNAVNLPLEGISLLLTVDWFLDRVRTTVNVWGDSVVTACVDEVAFKDQQISSPVLDPTLAQYYQDDDDD